MTDMTTPPCPDRHRRRAIDAYSIRYTNGGPNFLAGNSSGTADDTTSVTTWLADAPIDPPLNLNPARRYAAFMSYSHGSDLEFARHLQRAIHHFGRPWKRLPPLRIFRDRTNLSANPELWLSICAAMDGSDWFILLLSEKSRHSEWVGREITRWFATKPASRIILVITDGEWAWDDGAGDFDRQRSTAVHDALFGRFDAHPYVLDMRWIRRGSTQLTLDNGRFEDQVLEIAAALHAMPKDEIEGEVVRHHRRTRRRRSAVIAILTVLLAAALVAGVIAAVQASKAQDERDAAIIRELIAQAETVRTADPQQSLRLALAAHRLAPSGESAASLAATLTMNDYAATLHGHTSSVFSAAFSPNQRLLASGDGDDHTVRLWDVADLTHPRPVGKPLTDHTNWVLDIAFSPDGHTMATASNAELILWNVDNPRRPRKLATIGTDENVGSITDALGISFDPAGDVLISTHGGVVRLWDVRDPASPMRLTKPFAKHANDISDVAYSPDGRAMALALNPVEQENSVLWLYDATNPSLPRYRSEWRSDEGRLTALAFVPGRSILVTAFESDQFDDPGGVILWDVGDPAKPVQLGNPVAAHTSAVQDIAVSPDGETLTTVSSDATAINWDITNPAAPRQIGDPLTDHTNDVYAVAYRADGAMATGSADNNLVLWHAADDSPIQPVMRNLPSLRDQVTSLAFGPDRRVLATASSSGQAALWDLTDPARPRGPVVLGDHRKPISAFAFRSDGTLLATAGRSAEPGKTSAQEIHFWDVRDPSHPRRVGPTLKAPASNVVTLQFSADSNSLWAATRDVSITRWDITDLDHPQRAAEIMKDRHDSQDSVAFRPDFRAIASVRGFGGNEVGIRDITDPDNAKLLEQPIKHPAAAAMLFGPDGKWMVTAGIDVMLWDVSTAWRPQQLGPPLGTGEYVVSLALNANGDTLAVGDFDRGISFWDVDDRRRPHLIGAKITAAHSRQITSMALSPDGKVLVSGDYNGELTMWDLSTYASVRDHIVALSCERASRGFTQEEWTRHVGANFEFQQSCP